MAAKNVYLDEIIKRTQNVLGKYVTKPTLSEKLLRKPPFRFLFDILNVVIKETGCFSGLYTLEELTYENIKDRDDKMKFLQKMINVINIASQTPLTVRTSKIVSGHEPEKTNELLLRIGEVIEKKLDWQTAVQQVIKEYDGKHEKKEEENAIMPKQKPSNQSKRDKTKETSKYQEEKSKLKTKGKVMDKKTKANEEKMITSPKKCVEIPKKERENMARKSSIDKMEKETKEKVTRSSKGPKGNAKASKSVEKTEEEIIKNAQFSQIKNSTPDVSAIKEKRSSVNKHEIKLKDHHEQVDQSPTVRRKSSLEASEVLLTGDILQNELKNRKLSETSLDNIEVSSMQNKISENNKILQPEVLFNKSYCKSDNMAHKQQFNVKRENTFTRENSLETGTRPRTSLRPPSARPASARPGAPRRRDKNVEIILAPDEPVTMSGINLKLDTYGNFDDDGEHLVIIEATTRTGVSTQDNAQKISAAVVVNEKQGHLVQQILKTQKDLVQECQENIVKQNNERFHSPTVRQSSVRHISTLRDIIQNLTKSINPLGKLMDFIPEDIDAMHLELSLWRDNFVLAAKELKREQSLTEETTEPLKHQLTQIDESIKEYVEMVDSSRDKILQNSQKILIMLSGNK